MLIKNELAFKKMSVCIQYSGNMPFCKFANSQISKWPTYDVVVVGGGHAGCEGATAAARKGAKTLLITHSKERIGEMSCNPSFGGIGKGHLMREIDAMDGVCARLCDNTGIHFHILNRRHGPAVIGLRALIDRKLYKRAMQEEIFNTPNLDVIEASVEDLCLEEQLERKLISTRKHCITGCLLENNMQINTPTIIITTGTFLNGMLHWGNKEVVGGRIGEASSIGLSRTFARLGFKTGRLSTGTPPRLLAKTIDYTRFTAQPTDEEPTPFSFLNHTVGIPRNRHVNSWLGYSNKRMVQVVRENIDEKHTLVSALNQGIKGPRYCPSLEAKCMRFPELEHRIFLEPEGLDSELIYPQGCALGFELEVQQKIMRTIGGLEHVEVTQAGYSVRYDYVKSQQLLPMLEAKNVCGLFLAGQINGTTGYEEAAAQGLIAGVNAAARARSSTMNEEYKPLVLSRMDSYIGVMIDDLINFDLTEPYRVFTSRAENRILLRPDNADIRLTAKAKEAGIVSDTRWSHYQQMLARKEVLNERLESLKNTSSGWNNHVQGLNTPGKGINTYNAKQLLAKHPELTLDKLAAVWPSLFAEFVDDRLLVERLRNEQRYAPMHKQMQTRLERLQQEMDLELPEDLDYLGMNNVIRIEVRERLHEHRPNNLAAAAKISGVNDTILCFLLRYARRKGDRQMSEN